MHSHILAILRNVCGGVVWVYEEGLAKNCPDFPNCGVLCTWVDLNIALMKESVK